MLKAMCRKTLRFVLLMFFMLFMVYSPAQSNPGSETKGTKELSEQEKAIRNLIKKGEAYRFKDQDSSLLILTEALSRAEQLNFYAGITKTYNALGKTYEQKGDFETSRNYFKQALKSAQKNNIPKAIPGICLEMGMLFRKAGQLDSAFFWVTRAGHAYEYNGEEYFNWKVHSLFAHLHNDQKEYKKAEEAFEKAWAIVEKGDNRSDQGYLLYSMGTNYFEAENFEKFAIYAQKWRDFNQKPETGNYIATDPDHMPTLLLFSPDDPANIDRMRKAIAHSKKTDNYLNLGTNERLLGVLFSQQGNDEAALKYYLASEGSYKKAFARIELVATYYWIYEIYKKQNKYQRALAYHEKYQMLSDSIKTEAQMQNVAELETRYETTKKEKEIAVLNSENQIKELQLEKATRRNIIIVIGLLAALCIVGLLLYFYRQKQRDNAIISKALSEKELLLREIHHRVKNNLQVISSLLSLQSRFIEDESALQAIKEGRDRVKSMALIHQDLYQRDNLTGIKMESYFEKLINSLFNSYNISPGRIKLETVIQNINLDVDTVIPLGLIVNELVSNALKHAFPNGRMGTITVKLKEEAEELQLLVADDGIGWKEGLNWEDSDSFGFRMINAFKNKLEAQLDIEKENGTQITMLIKEYDKVA